jgi:hypothetical protein
VTQQFRGYGRLLTRARSWRAESLAAETLSGRPNPKSLDIYTESCSSSHAFIESLHGRHPRGFGFSLQTKRLENDICSCYNAAVANAQNPSQKHGHDKNVPSCLIDRKLNPTSIYLGIRQIVMPSSQILCDILSSQMLGVAAHT